MTDLSPDALSDKILADLRRRPSHFFDLAQQAKKHRCGKADILFAIDLLRRVGYDIAADDRGRAAFVDAPDLLLAAEITHRLKTAFIGHTVYAYKTVQSTNALAAQLADAGAPDGSIVVAESQTRGRGRLGRRWYSPEEKGIYLSIILYPKIEPVKAPGLSVASAVSLADAFTGYGLKNVRIKWPNDCLIKDRKAAGILTELSAEAGKVRYVIVGIGLNINHTKTDFPPDISAMATSLRIATRRKIHRVDFLQRFLRIFEKDYRRFLKSGLKGLRRKMLAYSALIGREISLDMRGRVITGTAVDIDLNGNLVVETSQGRQILNAGEVTVVKKR